MSEKQPDQPDPIQESLRRQEQINAQIAQSMAEQQKLLAAMHQRMNQPPPAPRQPEVLPGSDDYVRGNQKLLDDLVTDTAGVLARPVAVAEQRMTTKLADMEQRIIAQTRAADIERQFYGAYPDLVPYGDWVAKLVERSPADKTLPDRLIDAAANIRSHLAQRDEWARGQSQETQQRQHAASSSGGRPAYGGSQGDDGGGEAFDELADRRAAVQEQKDWKQARRQPMPQEAYQRRATR